MNRYDEKFDNNPDTANIAVHDQVEHIGAYVGAAKAQIYARAAAKRQREWIAAGNQDLYDWVFSTGEYEPSEKVSNGEVKYVYHPMTRAMWRNDFANDMRERLDQWGNLSEKQTAALRRSYEKNLQWIAEAEQKNAERAANSRHIGTVGERMEFSGEVVNIRTGEGEFGEWTQTTVLVDGQKVVYWNDLKDAKIGDFPVYAEKGDRVTFMAAVKAHDEFRGEAQTIISRATKVINHTRRENKQ